MKWSCYSLKIPTRPCNFRPFFPHLWENNTSLKSSKYVKRKFVNWYWKMWPGSHINLSWQELQGKSSFQRGNEGLAGVFPRLHSGSTLVFWLRLWIWCERPASRVWFAIVCREEGKKRNSWNCFFSTSGWEVVQAPQRSLCLNNCFFPESLYKVTCHAMGLSNCHLYGSC